MYWIYGNKTHVVLVEFDADTGENDKPTQQVLDATRALAVGKFEAAQLPAGELKMLTYFTADEADGADEAHDLFIPEMAVIEAAREFRRNDDLTIDEDAVISGWNAQAWQYVSPEDVIEWMLEAGPVERERNQLDREVRLETGFKARLDEITKELSTVITPQALEPYVIVFCEEDETLVFHCQAESPAHAEEQLYDAHPEGAPVVTTPALAPAIRESLVRAAAHAASKD